jgi:CTP synthase (UTP-ammonia lyase)
MGIADADSAENASGSKNIVITPVRCELPNRAPGAPKLSGGDIIHVEPGTQVYAIYGLQEVREEFFCNYEVNPLFETGLVAAGLRVSGRGEQAEARAVELPGNRFFLATLYQPQLSSTPKRPHPIVSAFVEAAEGFHEVRRGGRNASAH